MQDLLNNRICSPSGTECMLTGAYDAKMYLKVSCDGDWCMQTLDERLDAAMRTLADAEQRLSLAEQSGAQHRQQHSSAQARCVHRHASSMDNLKAAEMGP